MNKHVVHFAALSVVSVVLLACSSAAIQPSPTTTRTNQSMAAATREIYVYKSPTCSCCHEWESYLISKGYTVRSIPTEDMAELKEQMRVPEAAWSCHTAVIDGYVVEGHVPVAAMDDLFARRPAIDGIALAGMPAGSPGMTGVQTEPFHVLGLSDGGVTAFGDY